MAFIMKTHYNILQQFHVIFGYETDNVFFYSILIQTFSFLFYIIKTTLILFQSISHNPKYSQHIYKYAHDIRVQYDDSEYIFVRW